LPKKWSCADTVIAHPLLPNFRKPLWSMAPPPLVKHQKSALINQSSESDCVPSAQALLQPKSSREKNAPQAKVCTDRNSPQYQKATFEVAKRFMEALVFMKTPWPILSDEKYSMVEQALKLAIEPQDHQWALAGSPAGTPLVCQLPCSPSLKIDPPLQEVVSFGFCLMLFYLTYDIDFTSNYTYWKQKISTIQGKLGDGAHRTVLRSYQLHLRSYNELHIQVKELLFGNAYHSKAVDNKKPSFMRIDVLDLIHHQFSSLPIAWGASQ